MRKNRLLMVSNDQSQSHSIARGLLTSDALALSEATVEGNIESALRVLESGNVGLTIIDTTKEVEQILRLLRNPMAQGSSLVMPYEKDPEEEQVELSAQVINHGSHVLPIRPRLSTLVNVARSKQGNAEHQDAAQIFSGLLSQVCEESRLLLLRLWEQVRLRDNITGAHIERVALGVRVLSEACATNECEADVAAFVAGVHDTGKIVMPDEILQKPDQLTQKEILQMQRHTILGAEILKRLSELHPNLRELLLQAAINALSHHERWDGKGYPQKLSGNAIPLLSQLTTLIDAFDAMTQRRPYNKPISFDRAVQRITEERGRHFSPLAVDIFMANLEKIRRIYDMLGKTKIVD